MYVSHLRVLIVVYLFLRHAEYIYTFSFLKNYFKTWHPSPQCNPARERQTTYCIHFTQVHFEMMNPFCLWRPEDNARCLIKRWSPCLWDRMSHLTWRWLTQIWLHWLASKPKDLPPGLGLEAWTTPALNRDLNSGSQSWVAKQYKLSSLSRLTSQNQCLQT